MQVRQIITAASIAGDAMIDESRASRGFRRPYRACPVWAVLPVRGADSRIARHRVHGSRTGKFYYASLLHSLSRNETWVHRLKPE
jgi:hypothetical protein